MPHEYCETCGSKLIYKFVFHQFNKSNGKKLYRKQYYCPRRYWYNAFLHDSYFVIGGSFGSVAELYTEDYVYADKLAVIDKKS